MDVVRTRSRRSAGASTSSPTRGAGTTFTVYLPLTLAVTQAVLVRSGGSVIALASGMVEQVLRLKADALAGHYESQTIEFQERIYPLHSLQQLLGVSGATEVQPYNSVLLLRSGIQRIALHVDELLGNQEIVVKSIGPQLARVPGVSGATVLATARIALIMNPVQLAQRALGIACRRTGAAARHAAGGREGGAGGGHGGRRLAHGAQDHRPPARARGLHRCSPPRTASTPSSR